MGKFRETNWFKRGELVDTTSEDGNAERPVEDRYQDDGVSHTDSVLYGVHTGETSRIPSVKILFDSAPALAKDDPRFASSVIAVDPSSARELKVMIHELKQRNRTIMAVCGAAALVLAAFVAGVVA